MLISELAKKYDARVAIVSDGYGEWVYSVAKKVDVNDQKQMSLVKDLSQLLTGFMKLHEWTGASSNNVFWNATDNPLSLIVVPDPSGGNCLSLINPKIQELSGIKLRSNERCGSFPNRHYEVQRKSYVYLVGYNLESEELSFEYGLKNDSFDPKKLKKDEKESLWRAAVVQHECNHIDGIVLPQIALNQQKQL